MDAKMIYDFLREVPAPAGKADMILALGSHDRRVPGYAADLYLSGRAPLLVCTGGLGRITRNIWAEPEAEIFGRICREKGVPAEHLLLEYHASNTGENFTFTRSLLKEQGIKPRSGLIVCKPYMNKRALATGQKQWPEVSWSVGTPEITFEEYFPGDPSEQEIAIMVGDLFRLQTYAEKGFQVPVEISEEIRRAGERLVQAGYGQQVV
mgnify:CR=1 FL=1